MAIFQKIIAFVRRLFGRSRSVPIGVGVSPSHVFGHGGGGVIPSTLSAPTLDYPSPLATNPSTVTAHIGVDWISGNIFVLAYSASAAMTSPTLLTHTINDTDITNGTATITLPTFVGINYLQAYGRVGAADSINKSGIVTWGDTTAPTITNTEIPGAGTALQTYETITFFQPITTTDTGGVPALVSNGTTPGGFIAGGADQLKFEVVVVGGVLGYRWVNNGTASPVASPTDFGGDNYYDLTIGVVDYGGNVTTKALEVHVQPITVSSFSFTNVSGASLSTLYTSNTVTFSIAPSGVNVAASVSGTGFTYSKNGGAYQAAGSFSVQNGDTLALEVTSGASNSITETATVTVGTQTTTWSVATPGSAAQLSTTNGTNKSQWTTVTGSPPLSFSVSSGNGVCCSRTNLQQAFTKAQMECTVTTTGDIIFGVDDGTTNLNTSVGPGYTNSAGISVELAGTTEVHLQWNSRGTDIVLVSGAGTVAVGDVFTFVFDESAHTGEVWRTRSGTTTQMGTTQSSLPTLSAYYGFAGTSNSGGAGTMNYGATTYAKTPGTGVSAYWA